MPIGAPKSLTMAGRFFLEPSSAKQRQYEALRAYFVEGRPSAEVAAAFGYTEGAFRVLCHHFRRDLEPTFFASPQSGPRTQPKKSVARDTIIELRKRNYSVYEISDALKESRHPSARQRCARCSRRRGLPRCHGGSMKTDPSRLVQRSRRLPTSAPSRWHPDPSRPRAAVSSCLSPTSCGSDSMASSQPVTCRGRG